MANHKPNDEEDPVRPDGQDLTPPHGDELREEITFGRTDRYANLDDVAATRERTLDDLERPRDTTE